jgi:hypothetical protein
MRSTRYRCAIEANVNVDTVAATDAIAMIVHARALSRNAVHHTPTKPRRESTGAPNKSELD